MPLTIPHVLPVAFDAFLAILSDPTNGFNPSIAAAFGDVARGLDPDDDPPFVIDYSREGPTFFTSPFDPVALYENDEGQLPCQCLYETYSGMPNGPALIPANTFSGPVQMIVDTSISWPPGSAPSRFRKYRAAVADSLYALFMGEFAQSVIVPSGIQFNGRLQIAPLAMRTSESEGAITWIQTLRLTIDFGLNL